jgi:hypothetical protein
LPHLIIAAIIFSALAWTAKLSAQVTIGDDALPRKGAILDLQRTNSGGYLGGLLFPSVAITSLDSIPADFTDAGTLTPANLVGLAVYNTNKIVGEGIYFWNGSHWLGMSNMKPEISPYPVPTVITPSMIAEIPVQGGGTRKFLTFNLGGNPNLSPKEQIAYSSKLPDRNEDVTVHGGLFQWGRKDIGHSMRFSLTDKPEFFTFVLYNSSTYNPATSTQVVRFDYMAGTGTPNWYDPPTETYTFWGDGGGLSTQASNPVAGSNNPCPTGWRVPTQHEWALIGHEGGNSLNTDADSLHLPHEAEEGVLAGSGNVYWIPVINDRAAGGWPEAPMEEGITGNGYLSGFALYEKNEWENACAPGNYFDPGSSGYPNRGSKSLSAADAPNPLMFLPAAGMRFNGSVIFHTGDYGAYWSSTIDSSTSTPYYMYFIGRERAIGIQNSMYPVFGLSVRCIEE